MIHMAMAGCGKIADLHARNLQQIPEVQVVALMDPVSKNIKTIQEKYFPQAAAYTSYETLLAQPPVQLDAVLIATPHVFHYPQAKAALERGLHVLIEKPMVVNAEHAYDLWRTAKKTGRILGIAAQAAYKPRFGYIARERDAGNLGKFNLISGWMAQNWVKSTTGTWRQDAAIAGGGQLYDTGAHLLHACLWLVNEPVVEAACFYQTCGYPVDVNGVAILKFQGGAIGSIAIGGNCPGGFQQDLIIQTDKLLIRTDQWGRSLDVTRENKQKVNVSLDADDHPAAGTAQLNFIRAILGSEPPRVPARYGVMLSVLMEALYESAHSGRVVKVKPVPNDL